MTRSITALCGLALVGCTSGSGTVATTETGEPITTTPTGTTATGTTPTGTTPTGTTPTTTLPTELSVLFVGNSFTFWNNGLDLHFDELGNAPDSALIVQTDSVTQGGASLEVMWNQTPAQTIITNGGFDVVVLQEDIPETDVDSFHAHTRLFVDHIRAAGAEPVLFMAWPYDRLGWIDTDGIATAHTDIATELGVSVAPVALAWEDSAAARPSLDMYDGDNEHPSIHGTYLAVSVVYAVLADQSPEGLAYAPSGVSFEESGFLQQIAWDRVQMP